MLLRNLFTIAFESAVGKHAKKEQGPPLAGKTDEALRRGKLFTGYLPAGDRDYPPDE